MSTQSNGLYVSKSIHKAFIETSENITETAAATVSTMMYCCVFTPVNKTLCFTVDHPFVYTILFKSQILFMGKVTLL